MTPIAAPSWDTLREWMHSQEPSLILAGLIWHMSDCALCGEVR